jgi:asparagine synthase (glutamine-hydrolysing)
MCGVAGLYMTTGKPDVAIVKRMTASMSHRGPDADGFYADDYVALGHRRLSIIDLSDSANQPLPDASGRYILVFNGEIYNYQEIKHELNDYPFKTSGDSEVILAAFSKWGIRCVKKFKGMFVFAIWDKIDQALTIVRDRFGVKPLYYFNENGLFLFASEIRAILSSKLVPFRMDENGLYEFLSFQSVGSPHTLCKGIRQLESGHYIRVSHGKTEVCSYWNEFEKHQVDFQAERGKVLSTVRDLMYKSVERRMVADVPVGAFLSGGIDSSAVVGIMSEVSSSRPNTFNIYFDEEEYDESKFAEIVAKKFRTNHVGIHLKPSDFLDQLQPALSSMDTPSGDGVNTYVVSREIRKAGMTVALSGIGGDELFAGYPVFFQYLKLQRFRNAWPYSSTIRSAAAALVGKTNNRKQRLSQILGLPSVAIEQFYPVSRTILTHKQIADYTKLASRETALFQSLHADRKELSRLPLLSQVSVAEYRGYTQQTLLKDTDQMSMASSLEVREPFFDHDLIEYVLSITDTIKFPHYPKQLLVESLGSLLPKEIVHRKKKGFSFPWKFWMRKELRNYCTERITSISQRSFMKQGVLEDRWERFVNGDNNIRWAELWIFVVLEEWLRNNETR